MRPPCAARPRRNLSETAHTATSLAQLLADCLPAIPLNGALAGNTTVAPHCDRGLPASNRWPHTFGRHRTLPGRPELATHEADALAATGSDSSCRPPLGTEWSGSRDGRVSPESGRPKSCAAAPDASLRGMSPRPDVHDPEATLTATCRQQLTPACHQGRRGQSHAANFRTLLELPLRLARRLDRTRDTPDFVRRGAPTT